MYWRYVLDTLMQLSLFMAEMLDYSSKAMGSAASARPADDSYGNPSDLTIGWNVGVSLQGRRCGVDRCRYCLRQTY